MCPKDLGKWPSKKQLVATEIISSFFSQANQSRLELKDTGALQTKAESKYIETDSMGKIMCFLNNKNGKYSLVETPDTSANLKMSFRAVYCEWG